MLVFRGVRLSEIPCFFTVRFQNPQGSAGPKLWQLRAIMSLRLGGRWPPLVGRCLLFFPDFFLEGKRGGFNNVHLASRKLDTTPFKGTSSGWKMIFRIP